MTKYNDAMDRIGLMLMKSVGSKVFKVGDRVTDKLNTGPKSGKVARVGNDPYVADYTVLSEQNGLAYHYGGPFALERLPTFQPGDRVRDAFGKSAGRVLAVAANPFTPDGAEYEVLVIGGKGGGSRKRSYLGPDALKAK